MGCAKSKEVRVAAEPEREATGQSGPGRRASAKDHLPSQTLPENPATGVSSPSGSSSTAIADPRAQLQACIDSHPVVIFSKSTCKRCAEVFLDVTMAVATGGCATCHHANYTLAIPVDELPLTSLVDM